MKGEVYPRAGKRHDLADLSFGRLSVIEYAGSNPKGKATWLCRCGCGTERVFVGENLTRGKARSCGCASEDFRAIHRTKHGHASAAGRPSGAYRSWHAARQRCENPNQKQFADYGGRGITFAPEWYDFRVFLEEMGDRPAGTTLDRIKNERGYEPGNCRWATTKEQNLNRRRKIKNSDVEELMRAARLVIEHRHSDPLTAIAGLETAVRNFRATGARK